MERLIELFNLAGKREVERYCRELVISTEEFADLIAEAVFSGLSAYRYAKYHRQFVPEGLEPNAEELADLAKSGVGPLEGNARKTLGRIGKIFEDRRLFFAHLFYTPDHQYWHLLYFDQRDFSASANHWKHGSHIHYSRDSFTNVALAEIWANITSESPKLPPSIHIRYDDHHNRRATSEDDED